MTRIAMTISDELAIQAKQGLVDFGTVKDRLQAVAMIAFGSEDVQCNPPVVGKALQAVLDEHGYFKRVGASTVTLEFIHVEETTQEDNDLAAILAVAVLRDTLPRLLVFSPNAFVIKNGDKSYGWDEAQGLDEGEAGDRTVAVVAQVAAFVQRRLTHKEAKEVILQILANPDGDDPAPG
ncbi:hypothetical protein KKH05_01580 [Patescibacteria group bacterium]|nr:hypothetical protein [Patescibacteria group bacterium]